MPENNERRRNYGVSLFQTRPQKGGLGVGVSGSVTERRLEVPS